ncbi:MAG: hypothetical protein PVG65_00570 [Candidatus Thorarchaeota archaeon]|jgi:hypothetical protein
MAEIRKFKTGATRDTSSGKLEYFGFMHPLCDYSYANYMNSHRKMVDGSLRDSNNWWGGFPKMIPLQSLCRHIEDLKLINAGYFVYEYRTDKVAERKVFTKKLKKLPKNYKEITEEECCNAIRFNSQAYLLNVLGEKNNDTNN